MYTFAQCDFGHKSAQDGGHQPATQPLRSPRRVGLFPTKSVRTRTLVVEEKAGVRDLLPSLRPRGPGDGLYLAAPRP